MKNVLQELIEVIKTKNSWGNEELLLVLLGLMAKYFKE